MTDIKIRTDISLSHVAMFLNTVICNSNMNKYKNCIYIHSILNCFTIYFIHALIFCFINKCFKVYVNIHLYGLAGVSSVSVYKKSKGLYYPDSFER